MLIDYEWGKLERRKKQKREAQRRYYARNAEKCRAMTKAWLEKNPEYQRQEGRDRYMLDPEKRKAKSRAYYAANRKRISAARRAKRSFDGQTASGSLVLDCLAVEVGVDGEKNPVRDPRASRRV